MTQFKDISEALIKGDQTLTKALVKKALDDGVEAIDILNKGLIKGMDKIGELWTSGEIFIPEVLIAARAMNESSELIEKELTKSNFKPIGTAIIGTVKGDLHDIGKNLVGMILKGKGFKIIDLGVDVTKEEYLDAAKTHQADFILCSSLITTTMEYMKEVVQHIKASDYNDQVKIGCGGAPVTEQYVKKIGADLYAEDAVTLANLLHSMIKEGDIHANV
jgi:corrinoid protein of di/trimethylamine methyltransferase